MTTSEPFFSYPWQMSELLNFIDNMKKFIPPKQSNKNVTALKRDHMIKNIQLNIEKDQIR